MKQPGPIAPSAHDPGRDPFASLDGTAGPLLVKPLRRGGSWWKGPLVFLLLACFATGIGVLAWPRLNELFRPTEKDKPDSRTAAAGETDKNGNEGADPGGDPKAETDDVPFSNQPENLFNLGPRQPRSRSRTPNPIPKPDPSRTLETEPQTVRSRARTDPSRTPSPLPSPIRAGSQTRSETESEAADPKPKPPAGTGLPCPGPIIGVHDYFFANQTQAGEDRRPGGGPRERTPHPRGADLSAQRRGQGSAPAVQADPREDAGRLPRQEPAAGPRHGLFRRPRVEIDGEGYLAPSRRPGRTDPAKLSTWTGFKDDGQLQGPAKGAGARRQPLQPDQAAGAAQARSDERKEDALSRPAGGRAGLAACSKGEESWRSTCRHRACSSTSWRPS